MYKRQLQTGFYTAEDGKTYYCDENGQMITGTKKIDGYYYYFKEDGAMHTGWHTSDRGATYYYDEDGHMTFKGKKIDGYWYYFNASNGKRCV